jgi:hypothetical protein
MKIIVIKVRTKIKAIKVKVIKVKVKVRVKVRVRVRVRVALRIIQVLRIRISKVYIKEVRRLMINGINIMRKRDHHHFIIIMNLKEIVHIARIYNTVIISIMKKSPVMKKLT